MWRENVNKETTFKRVLAADIYQQPEEEKKKGTKVCILEACLLH